MRIGSRDAGGFTLVELLVVIAIIGVLVGLTIPAVQAVRESARRQTCEHQMAQISLALTEYHAAMLAYPAGTLNPEGPIENRPVGYHHNWVEGVLTQLDLPTVAEAIDGSVSVYAPENADVRAVRLPVLQCPSAPNVQRLAVSNYAGCHHSVEVPIAEENNGVFILNRQISNDDIRDGLQFTLLIGEKLAAEEDLGWMSGTRATLRNTGHPIGSAYQRARGPASDEEAPLYVGGFASAHPGGANFLLGDGHIRFFSASTDAAVLEQMADRADGRLPPSGSPFPPAAVEEAPPAADGAPARVEESPVEESPVEETAAADGAAAGEGR